FPTFDLEEENFIQKADSSYQEILKFYTSKKEDIQWYKEFDVIARACVDYPYYTKKEFYPIAHRRRMMKEADQVLSSEFYNHRKKVNFNSEELVDFWPYVQYINTTIDNLANKENIGFLSDSKTTLKKMDIIDSITENQSLKNRISHNIAFRYLMEKEENATDNLLLEKFYQISTDSEKKDKRKRLVQSIQNLTETGRLPNVNLKDLERNTVSSNDLFERKTILYFWSVKNENHFFAVHKKLQNLMEKHPDLDVMAVNLDESFENWKAFLNKNKPILNSKIKHYQAS